MAVLHEAMFIAVPICLTLVAFAVLAGFLAKVSAYNRINDIVLYISLAAAALVAGACILMAAPPPQAAWLAADQERGGRGLLRVTALFLAGGFVLVAASAAWNRLRARGPGQAARALLRHLPALVTATAAAVILLGSAGGGQCDMAFGALASDSRGVWAAIGVIAVMAVNVAGVSHALLARGLDRLAALLACVVPSLLAATGTTILCEAAVGPPDLAALATLLGCGPGAARWWCAAVRWSGMYLAAVVVLALAQSLGMRLAPDRADSRRRPRRRPRGTLATAGLHGGAVPSGVGAAPGPPTQGAASGTCQVSPLPAAWPPDTAVDARWPAGLPWPWLPALGWAGLALWCLLYPFDFCSEPLRPWLAENDIRRIDLLSNLGLLVPWGILGAWFGRSVAMRRAAVVAAVTSAGLLLSLLGESLQVLLPGRESSAVDLLANTLGAALGSMLGWLGAPRLTRWWSALHAIWRSVPGGRLAMVAVAAYVLARTAPFDISLQTRYLAEGLRASIDAGGPFSGWLAWRSAAPADPALRARAVAELTRGALGALGGLAVVLLVGRAAAARRWPAARSLAAAALLGAGLVVGTELLQWPIRSRLMDLTDLGAGAVGAACGLCLAALGERRGRGQRQTR